MRKVVDPDIALIDLMESMALRRAVSIRYVKETGEISRRKIEIHEIWVSKQGNILIEAHDHKSGEHRSFRVDRITHFTQHRSAHLADYVYPIDPPRRQTAPVDIVDRFRTADMKGVSASWS